MHTFGHIHCLTVSDIMHIIVFMRRHTTIDLDAGLVEEAKAVLGTRRTTETIHAALREVVRARQRRRLLELDVDLAPEDLVQIRRWRAPAAE
jgi:Arc/MetJ family transcription regulator